MKKFFLSLALVGALLTPGCMGLMPKKVELFQDKVVAVPEVSAREKETQRQAAARAALRARDTLVAAVAEESSTNVVVPATDTVILTESVAKSVGPPLKPSTLTAEQLATKLDSAVAALTARMDSFKADNNENAGKKIEGTGLFQIPYFLWLGGFLVMAFVGFIILTVVWGALKAFSLANPPLALGLNAASLGAKAAGKGLTQLIKGGEEFKARVVREFGADNELTTQVVSMFTSEQKKAQDEDVKTVVSHLTK